MSDEKIDLDVVKRGESLAQIRLRRSKGGITVFIKTRAEFENLMAEWGAGSRERVGVYGRYWASGQELEVYALRSGQPPHGVMQYAGGMYRIDNPGQPLITEDNSVLNISFIRLVGISENGVTFTVNDVYSLPQLRSLGEKIKQAIRQLYVDYMMPVDIVLTMNTEEVRL